MSLKSLTLGDDPLCGVEVFDDGGAQAVGVLLEEGPVLAGAGEEVLDAIADVGEPLVLQLRMLPGVSRARGLQGRGRSGAVAPHCAFGNVEVPR